MNYKMNDTIQEQGTGAQAIGKYSVSMNLRLVKNSDSKLGTIFVVKDAAFSDFEMTLLAKDDGALILGITDVVGSKEIFTVTEFEHVFKQAYITAQLQKTSEGAEIELYFNSELKAKKIIEGFFWPPYFKPKLILGSPIGGTFPCLVSEVLLYNNFLNKKEIKQISDYLAHKPNNQSFETSMELAPGRHYEFA